MDWSLYLTIVAQVLASVVALAIVVVLICAAVVGIKGMFKGDE